MKEQPLKGIRIIDLTHAWAGPHATRLMADFGAEVIRVEYVHRLCLLRGGRKEHQAYNKMPAWFQINRNKYSITLDLKSARDKDRLRELIKIADIFVENGRSGVMATLSCSYEDLIKLKPDIILMSMAGFGSYGPYATYAGYGATFEAMSGIQSLTAYNKSEKPYRLKEMDIINGIVAVGAIMTALVHRQKTGLGQYIDFSHMEAASHGLIGEHFLEIMMHRSQTLPLGNRHRQFAPQGCYPCQGTDKWLALTIRSEEEWQRFCEALRRPEWMIDARFATESARRVHHDELDGLISEWTKNFTPHEAMTFLQHHGVASGAVQNLLEISKDPHLFERDYFIHTIPGTARPFMGMPFRLSGGVGKIFRRGPDLGQDNHLILEELLGIDQTEIDPVNENDIGTAYDPE